MTPKYIRISELIYHKQIGSLSAEEADELHLWLQESEKHLLILKELEKDDSLYDKYQEYKAIRGEKMWNIINRHIVSSRRKFILHWAYPACACLIIGLGLFLWNHNSNRLNEQSISYTDRALLSQNTTDVILHLADGQQIRLSDSNMVINNIRENIKKVDNSLMYSQNNSFTQEKLNTLIVPRGGEFRLTLSDGTRVWLNTCSEIEYPEVFIGEKRIVRLKGEAYFEVAKDSLHPFYVRTKDMNIKVIGTTFNVKSYAEDHQVVTTLLEGIVELSTINKLMKLKPNEQAILKTGELFIRKVEADEYAAWRNGRFIFRRERLEMIMKDIARWYNTEVYYRNMETKDIIFSGIMDRYKDIRETLKMLEKTGKVVFQIDKNIIIVTNK